VVAFNSEPHVIAGFTTDSARLQTALATPPQLAYGTHIYDAVDNAVTLLRTAKINAGSIVVLSDGADTGSRLSEAAVAKKAREARVRVDLSSAGPSAGTCRRAEDR